MPRTGISYEDVKQAADELSSQSLPITNDRIRFKLGTGSSQTIAKHLREYKLRRHNEPIAPLSSDTIPTELQAVITKLWQSLTEETDIKLSEQAAAHSAALTASQQESQKYKENNKRWQSLHDKWVDDKKQLVADSLSLTQAIEAQNITTAALQTRLENSQQQLEEKDLRITELHQLHKQAQINLEHFREAALEQRLIEEARFAQHSVKADETIKELSKQCSTLQEANTRLQINLEIERNEQSALQASYQKICADLEKSVQRLDHSDKERHQQTNAIYQLETQLIALSQQLAHAQTEITVLQLQKQKLYEDTIKLSRKRRTKPRELTPA